MFKDPQMMNEREEIEVKSLASSWIQTHDLKNMKPPLIEEIGREKKEA